MILTRAVSPGKTNLKTFCILGNPQAWGRPRRAVTNRECRWPCGSIQWRKAGGSVFVCLFCSSLGLERPPPECIYSVALKKKRKSMRH